MKCKPPKNSAKSHPANLIRLAYWRRHAISTNTISFGEVEALQKIYTALHIRQARHHLLIKL
jgi:hypothetical protein